jgi:hypothetical protein
MRGGPIIKASALARPKVVCNRLTVGPFSEMPHTSDLEMLALRGGNEM